MPLPVWIILFTAFGGIASAAFAGLFLLIPEQTGARMLPHFVSFATGALLGAALLALLPEAIEGVGPGGAHAVGATLVVGLGVFFVIEKLVLWRHGASHAHGNHDGHGGDAQEGDNNGSPHDHHNHALEHDHHNHALEHDHHNHALEHDHHDPARQSAAGVLLLIGDSIHNALDGVLIAAAFLSDVSLGLVTSLAVAAHEVPHRVGDFAILLHTGMSRSRALLLNMATGLASILGGIVAYLGLRTAAGALPYALALAAAGFLYIAVAGLIPALHRRADPRTSLTQVILMGLGVGVIAWAESLAHE